MFVEMAKGPLLRRSWEVLLQAVCDILPARFLNSKLTGGRTAQSSNYTLAIGGLCTIGQCNL